MDAKEKRTDRGPVREPPLGLSEAVDKLLTDSATRQAFTKDPIGTLEGLGVSVSDEIKQKYRETAEAGLPGAQTQPGQAVVIARVQTEPMAQAEAIAAARVETQTTAQTTVAAGVRTQALTETAPQAGVQAGVVTMPMTQAAVQAGVATTPMTQAGVQAGVATTPMTQAGVQAGVATMRVTQAGVDASAQAIVPGRQTRVAELTVDQLEAIMSSVADRLLSGLARLKDRPGSGNL